MVATLTSPTADAPTVDDDVVAAVGEQQANAIRHEAVTLTGALGEGAPELWADVPTGFQVDIEISSNGSRPCAALVAVREEDVFRGTTAREIIGKVRMHFERLARRNS